MNATYQGSNKVYVNWRLLGTDASGTAFNLYRITGTASAVKLNASPITNTTDYVNTSVNVTLSNTYYVKPVVNGVEGAASESFTLAANPVAQQYRSVPLQIPLGGTTPDGVSYTYNANDTSAADLDGDGQYELIVKWDPSNSKDNSQSGYTGNVYIDAYQLDGTRLWRIDLGRNIRAGAHYTQFMVYDFDGDGKAEMGVKTAPGTLDGLGNPVLLGSDQVTADYRTTAGYILSGPEYLTIFNGLDGRQMATTYYQVPRGTVSNWGDSYGNRVDRFLAGVGYFDGEKPSLLMCRGYYTRTVLTAWDYRNGQLTQRWIFDTGNSTTGALAGYRGQGAHSLTIGDVDGDGKDEVTYGAMAINDDGTPLYTTLLGHGDALHMSDMDPSHPGLEVYQVHETESLHQGKGGDLRDAATGALLAVVPGTGDVGRGCAFDIDPRYPGFEMWNSSDGGIYNVNGTRIQDKPSNMPQNFGIWWDADPLRETLDGTTIGDWRIDATTGLGYRQNLVFGPAGLTGNNGTKNTPCLTADLYGDWREEVVWRKSDNTELQIWSTTIASTMRLPTLMHDIQYREAVAWQNVGYNQPPHTSYFLGQDMTIPAQPNVYVVQGGVLPTNPAISAVNSAAGQLIDLSVTPGSDPLGKLKYTWSVVGTAPAQVAFTNNGRSTSFNTSAMFIRAGTYTLRATVSDGKNSTHTDYTITVDAAITSIEITGSTGQMQAGQTRQFGVVGYDQFGDIMTPPNLAWSLGAGSTGSVNASGLYTAGPSGSATIIATSGSISDSVSIVIGSSAPTVATPASGTSTTAGTAVGLSVLGADDGGESNLTYLWSIISGPAAVNFSSNGLNVSKSTIARFSSIGTYQFKVTITDGTGLSTTSTTSVAVQPAVASVTVSPGTASIGTTQTKQFAATVKDQFGATLIGQAITWSISAGAGAVSPSGLFTAAAVSGKTTLQASAGSKFSTAVISTFSWSPYSLTARKVNASTVAVSFRDSATIETGFELQVGKRLANGTIQWLTLYTTAAAAGSGGTVNYTVPRTFTAGTWAIRVRASSATGKSNWSNTATITM